MRHGILKFAIALSVYALLSANHAQAEEGFWKSADIFNRKKGVQPVSNASWAQECSACHFAYQPGLLPGNSWDKLLTPTALHNHFGEVADLDAGTLKKIRDYALDNAAEKSSFKLSRKITVATENVEAPLRITDVRVIRRKHHDIPERMIKGNKDVRSLSNCEACHTGAEKGRYDSDAVLIPNYPNY